MSQNVCHNILQNSFSQYRNLNNSPREPHANTTILFLLSSHLDKGEEGKSILQYYCMLSALFDFICFMHHYFFVKHPIFCVLILSVPITDLDHFSPPSVVVPLSNEISSALDSSRCI